MELSSFNYFSTKTMNTDNIYPYYLQNFTNLQSHFQEQFDGLNSYERGDRFAAFVQKIIPYTALGRNFEEPTARSKSHDGGVDFEASSENDNSFLFTQSKYSILYVCTFRSGSEEWK